MTKYRCPHCGGTAKKVNKEMGVVVCEGELHCQFSGYEDDFESVERPIVSDSHKMSDNEKRQNDEVRFAKYEKRSSKSQTVILKDGHTMFSEDVVRDLNRKSFLEEDRAALQDKIAELEDHKRLSQGKLKLQRQQIAELEAGKARK